MPHRWKTLGVLGLWLGCNQAWAGMCAVYMTAYGGTYKLVDYNTPVMTRGYREFETYDSKDIGGQNAILPLATLWGKNLSHTLTLDDGSQLVLIETEESCLTPGYVVGKFLENKPEIAKARYLRIIYKGKDGRKKKKKCIRGQVGSFGIQVIIYPTDLPKKYPKIFKRPFSISNLKPGEVGCDLFDDLEKVKEALQPKLERLEEKAKQFGKDLDKWNKKGLPDWLDPISSY